MIRFASLGSGSAGNGLLVEGGGARVLVDCGFGLRETEARLAHHAVDPQTLSGILVTHEHGDHVGGVFRLARRYRLPVWLTHGTQVASQHLQAGVACRIIDSHAPWAIGDLEVMPFPVPHDAREPVQYVFSVGAIRLGLLTDAGEVTGHMIRMLKGCAGLVLECNHDREMLARSAYPASLKRRIGGRLGHLANDAAARLLADVASSELQHVVAAHLSEQNNRQELAVNALASVLGDAADKISVASQACGFPWLSLG